MPELEIIHFGPIPWEELQRYGYRKTSGAMFKSLWERPDIDRLWYVQMDRRWGFKVKTEVVDSKVRIVGLPIGLPLERFDAIRRVNRWVQSRLINKHLANTPSTKRVYWFYDWLLADLIVKLNSGTSIMELTDFAEDFFESNRTGLEKITKLKNVVREKIDIVFALSPSLAKEIEGGKCVVRIEPNAISNEFLERALLAHEEPAELRNLRHPRLCVVGTQWSLNHRIDHALLLNSINSLEGWEFILIGCEAVESAGLKTLQQMTNVSVLGMKPQNELVDFIQHCDVCAVPYEDSTGAYCLKILEYLACAKPVVSTSRSFLPSLQPFVRTADSADTFSRICRQLVELDPKAQRSARDVLCGMTWGQRADRTLTLIRELLSSRQESTF